LSLFFQQLHSTFHNHWASSIRFHYSYYNGYQYILPKHLISNLDISYLNMTYCL